MGDRSIVLSGALFAAAAIALMALAYPRPLRPLMLIAAATLLFALGCFLTIWGMSWSPQQAQWPIGTACVAFAIFIQSGWQAMRIVRRATMPQEPADPASTAESSEPLPYG